MTKLQQLAELYEKLESEGRRYELPGVLAQMLPLMPQDIRTTVYNKAVAMGLMPATPGGYTGSGYLDR